MQYFNQVMDSNGYVYSCDNIRLVFDLKTNSDLLLNICQFCIKYCDKYYTSFKTFDYKYIFTFSLNCKNTFSVLVGLNNFGKLKPLVVVDFNPNKCMEYEKFKNFMVWLFEYITYGFNDYNMLRECFVKRYDLAVDIPVNRKMFTTYWDRPTPKKYETCQKTIDDKTEYYGERNTVGRVKIYNKSLEDVMSNGNRNEKQLYKLGKLPYWTRVEVTHDTFDAMLLYSSFPSSFTRYDVEYLEDDKLTQVDYILIHACRQNSDYLRRLKTNRKKWEKLREFINPIPVDYDIDCLEDVLFQICCYTDVSMYGSCSFDDIKKRFSGEALSSYSLNSISFDNVTFVDVLEDGDLEVCEPELELEVFENDFQ